MSDNGHVKKSARILTGKKLDEARLKYGVRRRLVLHVELRTPRVNWRQFARQADPRGRTLIGRRMISSPPILRTSW